MREYFGWRVVKLPVRHTLYNAAEIVNVVKLDVVDVRRTY